MTRKTETFNQLCNDLTSRKISRRTFYQQSIALGVGIPAIASALAPLTTVAQNASPEPTSGGTVTVALSSEPTTINRYVSTKSADGWISNLTIENLVTTDPDGEYVPVLAAETPTLENGGVSEDGLTVTYKLRDDVVWSDGEPFTSADVLFTYNVVMDDVNPVASRTLYNAMSSVETPDEYTVVVTYSQLTAGNMSAFGSGILPEHYFNGDTDLSKSDFDRNPVGTGPFIVKSWSASQSVIFEPNPNYREAGKPYLDSIIFAIVPSSDVATAQLEAGEVDIVLNLRENDGTYLEQQNHEHLGLLVSTSPSVERVQFNLAAPGVPADPNVPHPVLGDPLVREALSLATPREEIVNDLVGGGFASVTGSTIPIGWSAPEPPLEIPPYDLEQAGALLDEAGWELDGDIRKKNGEELRVRITSTPDQHRTLAMQVLAERWKMIGVNVEVSNQQSTVILGSWQENGLRAVGDYDSIIYAASASVDPHLHFRNRYHSAAIATAENGGSGENFSRLNSPELDALIDEAGSEVDQNVRKDLYRQVNEVLNSTNSSIWLYARAGVDAYNVRVGGLVPNAWSAVTFNTEDWHILEQ